jgi:hypothetical protein
MVTFLKRMGAALAVCGLFAVVVPEAQAQRFFFRRGPIPGPAGFPVAQNINPPFQPTWLQRSSLANWAYNTALVGKTYANIPPWVFGYNPYPPLYAGGLYTGINPGLTGGGYTPGGYPGGGGGYNPYAYPGGGGYSPGYDPSGYGGYSSGYNPYYNPYYYSPDAAVISSYGQLTLQQEQARLLREQVEQAKLDTKKKKFDLAAYIRDNTPTFWQDQARIKNNTLRRIQTTATPSEIWSGKSLNVLLEALARSGGQKSSVPPPALDEDTIKHLNVAKKYGNVGLLRNNGTFTWPSALRNLVDAEQRNNIDKETQRLFRQAANAQIDADTLRDLRADIDKIRKKLVDSANEIRQVPYMEAKRFLNDFDDALTALENGDATAYFDFQSKFAGGGKTVEDLIQYMAKTGMRFAPATNGDENAYQALHDALVAYSMGYENLAADTPRPPRNKE